MRKSALAAGLGILALAAGLTVPAQAHRNHEPRVLADGLVGPLTLAVADRGGVLVTQSFAGLLSRVDKRGRVTDLHQIEYPPDASELIGVAYDRGATYHIETDYSGEAPTSHVVKTSKRGTRTVVSDDLWAYEMENNPDASQTYGFRDLAPECAAELAPLEEALGAHFNEYTGIVESHAYQLDVHRGSIYVADAAANAVLRVSLRTGDISTVAVLPAQTVTFTADVHEQFNMLMPPGTTMPDCVVGADFTTEPVPTDVQVSKHGKLYVSTLEGGVGELMPLSKVYRVDPRHGTAREVAGGMHGVTGLALHPRGIVVAEMFGGEVSVIRNHHRGTRVHQLFATEVPPADVDVRGSTVYATTIDLEAGGTGALLKYTYRGR